MGEVAATRTPGEEIDCRPGANPPRRRRQPLGSNRSFGVGPASVGVCDIRFMPFRPTRPSTAAAPRNATTSTSTPEDP